MKTNISNVIISIIVTSKDDQKAKAAKVNKIVEKKFGEKRIQFILNDNINLKRYLTWSKQ